MNYMTLPLMNRAVTECKEAGASERSRERHIGTFKPAYSQRTEAEA